MIKSSELILNPDGSVYHLNLKPEHIAHDIIFVGDPDRVSKITQHFESIKFSTQKREFKTTTGSYKGKRLTVQSTGIGSDNIDIVMNELNAFISQTNWDIRKGRPTVVSCNEFLENKIYSDKFHKGFTGTAGGFYGPQGRVVRLNIQDPELNNKMDTFNYNGIRMTNLEMETSAIYGLGKLLGHNCLSLNAIIANRAVGEFSSNPEKTVNELIAYTLDKLVE